ncbi:MAG: hypothetical protein A1D16_19200 [Flavihumibacter sp. CACIAM 22H1]|nr:MAG: hypothetical protein A1D16_19200 [Flavihumibacter sp. CACIAM 22H1]
MYSLSVINSFVEFSVGSNSYTDEESIKLQEKRKKMGRGRGEGRWVKGEWGMGQRRMEKGEKGNG